jgi:YidC/Oxa1 family membrane protein insertase
MNILNTIIYYPFLNLLAFFIWLSPGHYAAVGIILLTIVVRIILLVPSQRALQAQRKISQIQPLMEDLKVEYANDKQGLAVAQMDLYKKNDINPFSSCLLTLVQFPVLIILYHTIRDGLSVSAPHIYAWVPRAPFINTDFFGINLLNPDHTYILPILAALLQFAQVYLTTAKQPKPKPGAAVDPSQAMTKNMMFVFPLLTFWIAYRLPSALALYWSVTTIFGIVQQYFVNKQKFNISGVEKVLKEADAKHPEHHRSKEEAKEILEATSSKKGVNVTVRRKKS